MCKTFTRYSTTRTVSRRARRLRLELKSAPLQLFARPYFIPIFGSTYSRAFGRFSFRTETGAFIFERALCTWSTWTSETFAQMIIYTALRAIHLYAVSLVDAARSEFFARVRFDCTRRAMRVECSEIHSSRLRQGCQTPPK